MEVLKKIKTRNLLMQIAVVAWGFLPVRVLKKYTLFLAAVLLLLFFTSNAQAANVGDAVAFNVDSGYDATARSQVQATLIKITSSLYFYIETSWWNSQSPSQQAVIVVNLDNISDEFSNKIYPTLTSTYGSEANPGIDGDSRLTLLFESMNNNLGGYFRSQDEYAKLQAPDSNQREMLYMPITQINSSSLKVFLAHEFVHLITFNQKDRLQGVQEEVWLSEARSDYASTILGYDNTYEGSNLQRRVSDFLNAPNDSLTEWQNTKYDYATESVFTHYLVDHYGINILTDSLHSKLVGIPSINEALLKNGVKEDFAQIFTDWTIALTINDCSQNPNYCYTDNTLNSLKINPALVFLPLAGDSSLSMNNVTNNWSGNWQKIIGGNGDLVLRFSSVSGLSFQVPYIVYDKNNNYTVNFLKLDSSQKGEINIKGFGAKDDSLIILPSLQSKISGFDGNELMYPYMLTISVKGLVAQEDPLVIQKLLDQITVLKKQIADIQTARVAIGTQDNTTCVLRGNLYVGVLKTSEVMCLQQFLTLQGSAIYPEGFVTGNFGNLTKLAVIRFQEKYKNEILTPVGLSQGTGFVGVLTRNKINSFQR